MKINEALFNDNGRCGFVLKPEILTNESLRFNPLDTSTMKNKKLLELKVISAQKLPRTDDLVVDISDPYVKGKRMIFFYWSLIVIFIDLNVNFYSFHLW